MANENSVESDAVFAKASGRGKPGAEPPIPKGMPREEKKAVSSESSD